MTLSQCVEVAERTTGIGGYLSHYYFAALAAATEPTGLVNLWDSHSSSTIILAFLCRVTFIRQL